MAYSPDGRRLASASFDHKVKIWDPSTGQETLTLHGHTDTAIAVAFSPDGQRLASASEDGTIRIWDASPIEDPPARELLTLTGHTDVVRAVAYSRDGRLIASSGDDAIIRIWDADNGRSVRFFRGHNVSVRGLAFSPDGRRIASADRGRTIRVWDLETGSVVFTIDDEDAEQSMGIAYSPDGRFLATASGGCVDVWDATTGEHKGSHPEHVWIMYCVAFSHDGGRIASGSRNGAVKVSDASNGRLIRNLSENTGRTSARGPQPRRSTPCRGRR